MDTALVTAAQHGDEEAFASLALAVGARLHGSRDGPEDLAELQAIVDSIEIELLGGY